MTNFLLKRELTIFLLAATLMIERHHFLFYFEGLESVYAMIRKMESRGILW